MSLIDLVKQELGSDRIGHISQLIGEDSSMVETAISGAVPAIVGSIAQRASSAEGAGQISSILGKLNDSVISNMGNVLAGENAPKLAEQGQGMLSSIIGSEGVSSLASAVSSFSGMGQASSTKLLGVLGPISMGAIKQRLAGDGGINPASLVEMVIGEQTSIASALPEGFARHLDGASDLLGNLPGLGKVAGVAGATAVGAMASGLRDQAQDSADAAQETMSGITRNQPDIDPGKLPNTAALMGNMPEGHSGANNGVSGSDELNDSVVSDLQDVATEAVSGVADYMPDLAQVQDSVQTQADSFLDSVSDATANPGESPGSGLSKTANATSDSVTNAGENIGGAVSDSLSGAGVVASDAFLDMGNAASESASQADDAIESLSQQANEAVSSIQEQASEINAHLHEVATDAVNHVVDASEDFQNATANDLNQGQEMSEQTASSSRSSLMRLALPIVIVLVIVFIVLQFFNPFS